MAHINKPSNSKSQENQQFLTSNLNWIHWLVISLSILVTIGAWYFSSQQLHQKIEQKFARESEQVVELVKERMVLYENALWAGVSLIDSNKGNTSYNQWLLYASSLNIDRVYPGINGIGVIYNIQENQMEDYLKNERIRRPDYKLHPQHNESEYWPITYIEPAAPNLKAVGLDMAFETNRYTGIKKARDSGLAQLTGPIVLVQDSKKTPGFLFYTPFYDKGTKPKSIQERRNSIVGVTYAPFIMEKLMKGTLLGKNRHVGIKITDMGELLYDDTQINRDSTPLFTKKVTIGLYGRNWDFDIVSNLAFKSATSNNQPLMILLGGIIIDILLLSLFIFLSKAKQRALSYAEIITKDLREKTKELEELNFSLEKKINEAVDAHSKKDKVMAQQAKLAAMGEMVGSIAHQWRQPLNALAMRIQFLEDDFEDGLIDAPYIEEHSVENMKLVSFMSKTIDDFRNFFRIDKIKKEFCIVNALDSVQNLISSQLENHNIKIEITGDENCKIVGFESELQQVIMNLISNSKDVFIEKKQNDGKITIIVKKDNNDVLIILADNAGGIPQDAISRIFEPYFTTKEEGKGTGLGLYMSKMIIEDNMNGTLLVENTDEGALFKLKLGVQHIDESVPI